MPKLEEVAPTHPSSLEDPSAGPTGYDHHHSHQGGSQDMCGPQTAHSFSKAMQDTGAQHLHLLTT